MSMPRYRQMLHATDPYDGFDSSQHPVDVQGWSHADPIFFALIKLLRPSLILEFGSWKGASAIAMALICKLLKLETEIVCVDTWLGSAEHATPESVWRASLRHKNGYPQIYYTFLSNVIARGVQDYITPFPTTVEIAVEVFRKLGLRASLIYLDASHGYDDVVRDILGTWQLLGDTGVLLGDDFNWPTVRDAVNASIKRITAGGQSCVFYRSENKYILSRRPLPADLMQQSIKEAPALTL